MDRNEIECFVKKAIQCFSLEAIVPAALVEARDMLVLRAAHPRGLREALDAGESVDIGVIDCTPEIL